MNLLPEYNEILYHAKVCSELEFREYWNEVQSRLSVEVTDEEIDKQADYKYDNTSIQRSAWIGGAKWMRDRLTQPQSEWIGVEDRLPEPYGFYLAYDPNKNKGYERLIARFDAYTQFWYDESDTIHPTHWMPLPEPPKQLEP